MRRVCEACVQMLLAAGAAPNATDSEGATPLHRCAEVGATACARALLAAGATLERDKRGDSPLHVAAVRGHVDCMKCLVLASKSHGADTPRAADIRQSLADAPPTPPASDWIRYAYEDGTPYWYNPKTDESQWHEPGTAPPPEDAYAYDEPVFSPVPVEAPPPRDAPAFSPVDAAAPFETQRPPAFSPVDAAVETRPPAFSPVEAVAPSRRRGRRPWTRGRRRTTTATATATTRRRPGRTRGRRCAKRDSSTAWAAGGAADAANSRTSLAEDAVPPTPHNSRTSLAEDFEVQLPEPPVEEKQPESDAESDGMRAQQRHLDIWERFLTNAATRKFSGPRRDPAADKLLAAAAGDGYDDAEAAKVIGELLAGGTAPDASDEQGRRPLHHAAFAMALDRCQLLYDGGADVDASDKGGNRPLHVAAARGATAIVDFLLGCAASVDASNDDGDRPLHLSAWMGHADATARLIEGEANVDALNGQGYDPLDNILERSPCVAKQRARLLAGKRPKPLPGPLRATVQLLEEVRVRRSGAVVEEL